MTSLLHVLLTALLVFPGVAVRIESTTPHGVLYLLESLRGDPHHSQHLAQRFRRDHAWTPADEQALAAWRGVLDSWARIRMPGEGNKQRQVTDVLEAMAVGESSVDWFLDASRALLSVSDHERLRAAFAHFAPLYEEVVGRPCASSLEGQLADLRGAAARYRMGERLGQVARLFGASWPADFVVAVTPIPREDGEHFNVYGHSNGYLQVVEAPRGAKAADGIGVIFHELCHSLWAVRDASMSEELRESFDPLAWQELNEALATALGNAWVVAQTDGKPPQRDWYADAYIDGYAHALYPLLVAYLREGRALDGAFASQASAAFRARFPDADGDPRLCMREVVVVSESDDVSRPAFHMWLASLARISSTYAAVGLDACGPTLEEHPRATAVFLVRASEVGRLKGFPPAWLDGLSTGGHAVRVDGRWRVVCVGESLGEQKEALRGVMERKRL